MAKRLTRAEYLRAVHKSRRRYQTMSLLNSRVALQGSVAAPCYWFERDDVAEDDGTYWRDSQTATITLVVDGKPSTLFYLSGRKLDTCTFAYDLDPTQLARAVAAMRHAKLQRLIFPAAEWAMREMPNQRRPVLEKALRKLMRSVKGKLSPTVGRRRTRG